jgi:hypothetical protein
LPGIQGNVGPPGPIGTVTAGTGLSGGGSTATVTVSLTTPVSIANGGTNGTSQTAAFNNVVAPGGTVTGQLSVSGNFTVSGVPSFNNGGSTFLNQITISAPWGTNRASLAADGSANTVWTRMGGCRLVMYATNQLNFENPTGTSRMNIDANGNMNVGGQVAVSGQCVVNSNIVGNVWLMRNDTRWNIQFDGNQFVFNNPAGPTWLVRWSPDNWAFNNVGAIGGHGLMDFSDTRDKASILEATDVGMRQLRNVHPIRFMRTRTHLPRPELGFSAQDMAQALPDAVINVERAAGDQPRMAIEVSSVLAALVNAVKELDARLARFEGRD